MTDTTAELHRTRLSWPGVDAREMVDEAIDETSRNDGEKAATAGDP